MTRSEGQILILPFHSYLCQLSKHGRTLNKRALRLRLDPLRRLPPLEQISRRPDRRDLGQLAVHLCEVGGGRLCGLDGRLVVLQPQLGGRKAAKGKPLRQEGLLIDGPGRDGGLHGEEASPGVDGVIGRVLLVLNQHLHKNYDEPVDENVRMLIMK